MKNKKKPLFNSIKFKSWSYFVIFALSILLVLQFLQFILIEPFYRNTLKKELKATTSKVAEIYFSNEEFGAKNDSLNNLTASSNACILVYNKDTGFALGYDSLGSNGCAIYNEEIVNEKYINYLDSQENDSIFVNDKASEYSTQEIIIYGQKYQNNDTNFYILSNITLQSVNYMKETIQGQFIIITLIVLILAVIISLVFSTMLSSPIVEITNEASKITYGNYDVNFQDVSINEIQELAETIDVAVKEMDKAENLRKELMANVSHDIKTPLTMIKAYAEMIRDISGDDKQKRNQHLEIIMNESDTLNKLVNEMLDLSKYQAGAINLDVQPFELASLIEKSVNKFNTVTSNDNIEVIKNIEPELIVYGDSNKIEEVLNNFISNAIKHCGSDNKIYVNAFFKPNNKVRVEIIDHGSGISQENLPYIWDRYFKADKKYQRSQTGSGLGLAINKAILEAHNAEYGAISKENEGSTFYFELNSIELD